MKLISIDIETTGLNPVTDSVLEIGAVIFDPAPPLNPDERFRPQTFECIIKHERISGNPFALQLNANLIAEIAGTKETHVPIVSVTQAITDLRDFIDANIEAGEKLTAVGKNFDAFDKQFLNRMPGYEIATKNRIARRVLDVGSLCFRPGDGQVVNLTACLKMLGVDATVQHRALDDALDVMTVVTRFFAA
jgi:DNA polymerase III epsilon subunit-like protein